mgnify:CR=1 FL=1
MKKIISVLLLTLLFGTVFFFFFYDIMKKADEVPTPKTSSYTATMTLTDKKGNVRVREVKEMTKDFGDVSKSVIIFTTPKDVAGVGYLMFDYVEKSDKIFTFVHELDFINCLYSNIETLKANRIRVQGTYSKQAYNEKYFTQYNPTKVDKWNN